MKNVLLLIHDDMGQEARYQAALDLVRAVEGHLICVDVSVLPMAIDDYMPLAGSALLLAEERANECRNREATEARLAREDVPWHWIDITGDIVESLRETSGLADVIVINRQLDGAPWPDMRGIVGQLLVKGDTPVLAVPEDARGFAVAGHALVAWNGSRQASEALQAAVPLLALASEVTLLEVDDGSLEAPASEAAQYLSRHGIEPVVRRAVATVASASDVILADIPLLGADYLVMGGYGRSRLAEALLGGTTRRMLTECPVPLFLAH